MEWLSIFPWRKNQPVLYKFDYWLLLTVLTFIQNQLKSPSLDIYSSCWHLSDNKKMPLTTLYSFSRSS